MVCVNCKRSFSESLLPKASPLDLCFVFVPGPSLSINIFNLKPLLVATHCAFSLPLAIISVKMDDK